MDSLTCIKQNLFSRWRDLPKTERRVMRLKAFPLDEDEDLKNQSSDFLQDRRDLPEDHRQDLLPDHLALLAGLQMTTSTPLPWGVNDQWASYTDLTPSKPSDWTIGLQTTKDLAEHQFNGDILAYKDWRDRMREHFISTNHGYGRIIYEVEREKLPLSFVRIAFQPWLNGLSADLNWITRRSGRLFRDT